MPIHGPTKNAAFNLYLPFRTYGTSEWRATPTIAAGDVQVSKDGGAFANVTTLPAETPASGKAVKIALSATEMDADVVVVRCVDQTATKEWEDTGEVMYTTTGPAPTAAVVADAVWDEARADHTTAGSFGQGAASVQGNVTGSVASVTGLTASNLDAAVSSRATPAQVNAEADTAIADAALATAANLATVAGYIDTEVASILAAVDTEVAAIKAKTDNLPASPAAVSDIPSAASVATAVLGAVVETGVDLQTMLRRIGATTAGLLPSGAGTTTETFHAVGGGSTTPRVQFTVDADGNRTAVVYS